MKTIICGSLAYDTIMVFHDHFKNHILPEQIHILNVSFLVPDMRREYGGCAGNIAYNLRLLGGDPLIMATVGDDYGPYKQRLGHLGFDTTHIKEVAGTFTAQAFITTDLADNQITAFHPGAMGQSHLNKIGDAKNASLGIVSPDGRQGMLDHARQFHEAGIPFIFDPGQGMPMFDGADLLEFLKLADYCTVNDYEAKMLTDRTGKSLDELAKSVKALIVTLGGNGSEIYADGQRIDDPVRQGGRTGRPDRLRRRLPFRPALWHRPGMGMGEDGTAGFADGLDQDRAPRRPEPQAETRGNCRALPRRLRRSNCNSVTAPARFSPSRSARSAREHGTWITRRSSRRIAVRRPPQRQPVSSASSCSSMRRPSADQWPQTIAWSALARFGTSNHGRHPAGALATGPLALNSIAPPGEQKRMRVIALTTTRRRSQPARSSLQDVGVLPHMLARKSR